MPNGSFMWARLLAKRVCADAPLILIVLAHLPLIFAHFSNLCASGLHGHFPFALLAATGLLWNSWDGKRNPRNWRGDGRTLLLACGGLLFLAVRLESPWLGFLAALTTSGAILLRIHPAPVKEWVPAWLLLWLLLPLPMGLDRRLSQELQCYSSCSASLLLDFFRVLHVRTGNLLETPGKVYSVDEACSGIQSLFVLVAGAAILAVIRQRPLLRSVVLIGAAAAWAGVANMVRVAGVVVAENEWEFKLATGWRHELWGFALFAAAFGLLLSTDRLLWLTVAHAEDSRSFRQEDFMEQPAPLAGLGTAGVKVVPQLRSQLSRFVVTSTERNPLRTQPDVLGLGKRWSWVVTGLFASLAGIQCVSPWPSGPQSAAALSIHLSLTAESLPAELAGWRRLGFHTVHRDAGNAAGVQSAVWRFERSGGQAIVSLDYPFTSWHTLTECYRGTGGRVMDWHLEPITDANARPEQLGECAVVSLDLGRRRAATLLFAEWNELGVLLAPPVTEEPSLSRLWGDLQRRWARANPLPVTDRIVFQLQILVPHPRSGSTADDGETLRRLFVESLRVLRTETTETKRGGS